MKRIFLLLWILAFASRVFTQSEPSTYFNVYVPPNNEAIQRNVALIVTAVSDSTSFAIVDDGMDGDQDDSVSGMLMAGQSYILYMKDNGINDDALYASGGTLARNGDYYLINSDKLVYASMSTDSDWQHDFVPSVNKKSVGQMFFVYAPKVSSSPRDLNVFAYEAHTTISIYKISSTPTTQTGYTNVDLGSKQLVAQRTLQPGQDLIHYYTEGRDLMETGGTYLIESNQDISVQYGALWGNARDGGAYVPASNGSGSGELFYFAVPYQSGGEQEIRLVSWDAANEVHLSRYQHGQWVAMNTWTLGALQPADWVGKQQGNVTYPTVFRVTCSPGKRVSVMEANWMETGSTHTSDMSTMLSSETGTSSGKRFVAYMLPPSSQRNVVDPFTGQLFSGSISHFYLFAGSKNTSVTIKDAKTNGQVLSKTFAIDAGRYADAFFTLEEWKSIYNGTGTPSGPDRPYVVIEATEHIAVLSTNFNDNWMNYFGSSLPQSFVQTGSLSTAVANPGEEVVFTTSVEIGVNQVVEDASLEVKIASGLIPSTCTLKNNGQTVEAGHLTSTAAGSSAHFSPLPSISSSDDYSIETRVIVASTYNNGDEIPHESVLSVETVVSGRVEGEFQQSYFAQGIQNNAANTSQLLYSACQVASIATADNDSWNPSWVDYNQDGHEDLFIATKDPTAPNELYRNNGDGTFTAITSHPLVNEQAPTVAAVWADINNNGRSDVLLVHATQRRSKLFLNQGNGVFTEQKNAGIDPHPQYFHGAAFADFDRDGFVDLIITNFFPTRFHHLYRNNGDNTFSPVTNTPITTESERAMAPVLADYNNDGLVDIFIPNGDDRPNSLFKNLGNFQFEKVNDAAMSAEANNSVGAAWGDYNQDGYLDLVVVNASGQDNELYQNQRDGTFLKIANSPVSQQGGDSHAAAWLDMNLDGFLDLYITNDQGPAFLYLSDGQGGFTRKLEEALSGNLGQAYGVAVGDYNRDGHPDLAISTHTEGGTRLFCHNHSPNNWIGFVLQGVYSNRQAIGARVAIKAEGQWQYRQHLPVGGFGSQHTQSLHFGLGAAGTVDSVLIVWPSGAKQLLAHYSLNQYNPVLEEAALAVNGAVFHDINHNGLRDAGEPLVPHLRLSINPGSLNLASDEAGTFGFRTNEPQLEIRLQQPHWTLDPAYRQFAFLPGSQTLSVLLPVQAVQVGHDLSIHVATTAWRRGFTNETSIHVHNLGTEEADDAIVELSLPAEAYLLSADQGYTTPAPKTYRWNLGTLAPGSVQAIQVVDSIGLAAITGQTLLLHASVQATGTDLDYANNHLTAEVEVVGAIDPNDILVSPRGDGPEGYIHPDQWLTYTIRFENVGTYKATYVFLENHLPPGLDWSTFDILSSSHPYSYTLATTGKLDVAYRYIDLPPAMEDSIGAHGYFSYRIKPQPSHRGGTQYFNQARITFDFEAPIVTNTVVNTLKHTGSHQVQGLTLSPNPAHDVVQISLDPAFFRVTDPHVITRWVIMDPAGRVVLSGPGDWLPVMPLRIAEIPAGMYLLRAYDQFEGMHAGKLRKLP